MRVYLKTIMTSGAELVFIAAQFLELADLIDRLILIEPGFTHTGVERERIGVNRLLSIVPQLAEKMDYIPLPITDQVIRNASLEVDCHWNERLTRGLFTRYIDLGPRDIVIATDADEVLYAKSVVGTIERLSSRLISWRAEAYLLHQFVYSDRLVAPGFKFSGPCTIGYGRYFMFDRPFQWRNRGRLTDGFSGCHFSWCMPIVDLERKVKTFAHAPSYLRPGEDPRNRIESDIANKVYTFRNPPIPLAELTDPDSYWPKGYATAKSLFATQGED